MSEEKWMPIVGYEASYMVSNLGNIKSLFKPKRFSEKILKPQKFIKTGYLGIDLMEGTKAKKFSIHRIVAIAFIPNPENKLQVNHINGIKTDNRVENLEWCTRSENQKHSIRTGLRSAKGVKNSQCTLTEVDVLSILKDNRVYYKIGEEYGVSQGTVSNIKTGYSWSHITNIKHIQKQSRP